MKENLEVHPLGFITVTNKPSIDELQTYYSKKYYQKALGSYDHNYSKDELLRFDLKLAMAHMIIEKNNKAAKSFIDVGCGEGFSLAYFRNKGWDVKGLDFSSAGLDVHNPECSDALVVGNVFELLQEEMLLKAKYDVVWLQNVLEHVLDPVELLKSLKAIVKPGGVLVVTVPNDFSWTQKKAMRYGHIDDEFWVALPDHLSYFDSLSLRSTATSVGWDCFELLGDFPIDWFLYHSGSNYVRNSTQGKAAHNARTQLEVSILEHDLEDVIKFWSAAASLGIGRNITGFFR